MGTAYPHLIGVTTGRKEQAAAEQAQRRAWYRGEKARAAIIANAKRKYGKGNYMNFISREQVLEIIKRHNAPDIQREVETLFSFPAPNPEMRGDRNVMGQTEEQFWDAVERQDK